MNRNAPPSRRRVIAISTGTFLRALCLVVLVWLWLHLWSWVLIALIGVALAIAIEPAIVWFEGRRIPRWVAAPALVIGGAAVLVAFFVASARALQQDAVLLEGRVRQFYGHAVSGLPPSLREAVNSFAPSSDTLFTAGQMLVGGLGSIAVALALAVYFLLDGRRTYEWLVAFAPPDQQPKVRETAEGACAAIAAYMRGNLITSALTAVFTWVVLFALGVPASLLLGVLAGVCDLLPVVGIFLSLVPAVLLALTVSPTAAVSVAGFFLFYNLLENYYIQPKVYGRALRLSDLAVIGAFIVGAELGGVLGALVALPLAATYPVIERVWLRDTDRRDLARDHRRIEAEPEH